MAFSKVSRTEAFISYSLLSTNLYISVLVFFVFQKRWANIAFRGCKISIDGNMVNFFRVAYCPWNGN